MKGEDRGTRHDSSTRSEGNVQRQQHMTFSRGSRPSAGGREPDRRFSSRKAYSSERGSEGGIVPDSLREGRAGASPPRGKHLLRPLQVDSRGRH